MNSIFQIWALVALFLAFVLVFLNLDSVSLFGKLAEEDLPNSIYVINIKVDSSAGSSQIFQFV